MRRFMIVLFSTAIFLATVTALHDPTAALAWCLKRS